MIEVKVWAYIKTPKLLTVSPRKIDESTIVAVYFKPGHGVGRAYCSLLGNFGFEIGL